MTALTTTKDSHIVLRFLAAPMDITYGGTVHGGKLLEWIDKAGYACAAGWSGRYCVTAYVGDVRFTRPVASAISSRWRRVSCTPGGRACTSWWRSRRPTRRREYT